MTALYISGPISGMPEHNFPAFNEAADRLRKRGYIVINPADHGVIDGWAWEDYLRHDLRELLDCGAVATLPGWMEFRGANLEVHVADELGLRVGPVEHWLAWGPK